MLQGTQGKQIQPQQAKTAAEDARCIIRHYPLMSSTPSALCRLLESKQMRRRRLRSNVEKSEDSPQEGLDEASNTKLNDEDAHKSQDTHNRSGNHVQEQDDGIGDKDEDAIQQMTCGFMLVQKDPG